MSDGVIEAKDWVEVLVCSACGKTEVTPCDGYEAIGNIRELEGKPGNYKCMDCWDNKKDGSDRGNYRHLPMYCLAVDDGNRE